MEVCKNTDKKRSPSACATEAPAANYPNQENHQDDDAQDFDSDDDDTVETPVHDNEDDALVRECENCNLCIKQSVGWPRFLTDTSSNANNE